MSIAFCTPRFLPEIELREAVAIAYSFNPSNRIDFDLVKPGHLAILKTSYWGSGGVKLGVSYLEQVSNEFKSKFLEHANA